MTVHDKTRLLAMGLPPNGLVFKEDDGVRYLPFQNVPFELETIITRWLMILPPEAQKAAVHGGRGDFKGLTQEGWSAFVAWLVAALNTAQGLPDFPTCAAAAAQRHFD